MAEFHILPGEITDPDWPGPRCEECGRPVGGNGFTKNCSDMPQAHAAMDSIDAKKMTAFLWDNALRNLGDVFSALRYMTDGTPSPLHMIQTARGGEVLEQQMTDWPDVMRMATATRQARIATQKLAERFADDEPPDSVPEPEAIAIVPEPQATLIVPEGDATAMDPVDEALAAARHALDAAEKAAAAARQSAQPS